MEKIILYYKFVPVPDPETTVWWQRELCQSLNLRGRIIVSPHGINGTLGGDIEDLRRYKRAMNASGRFRGIDYKWTAGTREDFPKLSVKARPELVAFGAPEELVVDDGGVVGGGTHLSPSALHRLVAERGDEVLFFDGRNAYEAKIGKFANAIVPEITTTHDMIASLESPTMAAAKDRPVVTYCTGGIRCEILTALMHNRGFREVYQVDGGIVKYVQRCGEDDLWQGSVYTFDRRMTVTFDQPTSTLGCCDRCGQPTWVFKNCSDEDCSTLILRCEQCYSADPTCTSRASA